MQSITHYALQAPLCASQSGVLRIWELCLLQEAVLLLLSIAQHKIPEETDSFHQMWRTDIETTPESLRAFESADSKS